MRDDNFDENNYVKVNVRLAQFRNEYKEGRMLTIRSESEEGVSFKCLLLRDAKDAEVYASSRIPAASGHSFLSNEERDGDKVEEAAETVALGRALAMLGYEVEKSLASQEEMDKFNKSKEESNEDDEEENEDDHEENEEEDESPRRRRASSRTKLRSTRKIRKSSRLSRKK